MKFTQLLIAILFLFVFQSCKDQKKTNLTAEIIASGQMPAIVMDNAGKLNLVYGIGDSIMYSVSEDEGLSFSNPLLIDVLPELDASYTRGPQIAVSGENLPLLPETGRAIFPLIQKIKQAVEVPEYE